jgi:hypothetical protein
LKHLILDGYQTQIFCSADQAGTVPTQTQLKTIVLGEGVDG